MYSTTICPAKCRRMCSTTICPAKCRQMYSTTICPAKCIGRTVWIYSIQPSVLCVGAHLSCLHLAGQMVGMYTHTALPTLSLVYICPISVCMDMQCPVSVGGLYSPTICPAKCCRTVWVYSSPYISPAKCWQDCVGVLVGLYIC